MQHKIRGGLRRILGSIITRKKRAVFLAGKHNISVRLSARVICTETQQASPEPRDHPCSLCSLPGSFVWSTNAKSSFTQSIANLLDANQWQSNRSLQKNFCAICTITFKDAHSFNCQKGVNRYRILKNLPGNIL